MFTICQPLSCFSLACEPVILPLLAPVLGEDDLPLGGESGRGPGHEVLHVLLGEQLVQEVEHRVVVHQLQYSWQRDFS